MKVTVNNGGNFYTSQGGCLMRLVVLSIAVMVGAWLLPGIAVAFLGGLITVSAAGNNFTAAWLGMQTVRPQTSSVFSFMIGSCYCFFSRGSSTSSSPFPRKLKASTISMIAAPGAKHSHGAL